MGKQLSYNIITREIRLKEGLKSSVTMCGFLEVTEIPLVILQKKIQAEPYIFGHAENKYQWAVAFLGHGDAHRLCLSL